MPSAPNPIGALAKESPEAAIQLVLKIRVATEKLVSFPTMGRPGRVDGTKELVILGSPYLVIYRVKGRRVEILLVLHGSRKYPWRDLAIEDEVGMVNAESPSTSFQVSVVIQHQDEQL